MQERPSGIREVKDGSSKSTGIALTMWFVWVIATWIVILTGILGKV